jgi:hypothetical protein
VCSGIDKEHNQLVVAIIDFIRTYTWDKQLETWVKSSGILGGAGAATAHWCSVRSMPVLVGYYVSSLCVHLAACCSLLFLGHLMRCQHF